MRRALLKMGIPAVLVACFSVSQGNAALPVVDFGAITQALNQLRQLQQQYQMLVQQYQQLQATYSAVAHLPGAANQRLQQALAPFRNPLGTGSAGVGSMMNGTSIAQGVVGQLQARFLQTNRVYAPAGSDPAAISLNQNAVSIAGSQAMASQLYQSASDHAQALQGIEGELAAAPDAKAAADLQARASTEQAYFQAQTIQAQAVSMWQDAQQRNVDQQRRELRRQQIDTLIAQARANGAGS